MQGALRKMIAVLAAGFLVFVGVSVYALVQIADVTTEIQSQRRVLCLDQNARHDATVKALAAQRSQSAHGDVITGLLLAAGVKITTPRALGRFEARLAQQQYQSSVLLIGALAPRHDCSQIR